MVPATLKKNLGPTMSKRSNESYLQENHDLQITCTLSMICQTDVVNSNLFLQLTEKTRFDGLLTDMQMPRQNVLPYKKLRIHSFNILFLYTVLVLLPNSYLFKEIFLKIYRSFLKTKWYSIDILQVTNVYVKN